MKCRCCAYRFFAPINKCIGPMKVGDSRRDTTINEDSSCHTGLYTPVPALVQKWQERESGAADKDSGA